jgi:hypothetical protein
MNGIGRSGWLAATLVAAALAAPPARADVKVGDKAPAWELDHWVNSRPYKLSQLSGKAVLLEFWASW